MKNFGKISFWSIIIALGCILIVAHVVCLYITHAYPFDFVTANILEMFVNIAIGGGVFLGPGFAALGLVGMHEMFEEERRKKEEAEARRVRIAKAKEGALRFPSR